MNVLSLFDGISCGIFFEQHNFLKFNVNPSGRGQGGDCYSVENAKLSTIATAKGLIYFIQIDLAFISEA